MMSSSISYSKTTLNVQHCGNKFPHKGKKNINDLFALKVTQRCPGQASAWHRALLDNAHLLGDSDIGFVFIFS